MRRLRSAIDQVRSWLPALVALTIFGPIIWWSLDNAVPMKVESITAINLQIPRNGLLPLRYSVERFRHCPGQVQRVFVDAKDYFHVIEPYRFYSGVGRDGRALKLGKEIYNVTAPVPFGAAPGPARFQAVIEYFCNPLQVITQRGIIAELPVVQFEVTNDVANSAQAPTRIPGAVIFAPALALEKLELPVLRPKER